MKDPNEYWDPFGTDEDADFTFRRAAVFAGVAMHSYMHDCDSEHRGDRPPRGSAWAWGKAFRIIEALPDPRGFYESNCLGWPHHPGRCCRFDPPRCQNHMSLGLVDNHGLKFGHG